MRDVSFKSNTLRTATATAVLKMSASSVDSVKNNKGPKFDIPATARAASFLAAKNTHAVIPHCHPIPVEHAKTDFEYGIDTIKITVLVKAVYKTGVEMEALHAASVAALVIYDMLKPLDDTIEILNVRLEEKTGGKSDYKDEFSRKLTAAVIVCSDSVSSGKKQDTGGKSIMERLEALGLEVVNYSVIPDDKDEIRQLVQSYCDKEIDLVVTTGGTGLSPRDNTPEALKDFFDKEVPGIMEAARAYGQDRTPYSMMSRGIAGIKHRTLVITLPGSTRGAQETMDALFPSVLHIFKVIEHGFRHGK